MDTDVEDSTEHNHQHQASNDQTNDQTPTILQLIAELKTMLTTAIEQFKTEITSLTTTPRSLPPNAMDTESEEATAQHHPTPHSPDLAAMVNELKNELAVFVTETRTLLQQQNRLFIPFVPSPFPT